MVPKRYDNAEEMTAVDVFAFALMAPALFIGEYQWPRTLAPLALGNDVMSRST
jgi:hypothetical protein